ncbi:MAG: hypothetical protein ACRD0U_13840 [Acidimicrobiales bacterium]
MRTRLSRRIGAAALVMLALAACGGDDDDSTGTTNGGGGEADLVVEAFDDLRFDGASYTAPAGELAIEYVNEGSILHTLVIEDVDGFKLSVATRGDIDTGSVELEGGDYVLFCDVAGHRAAGMEATLTVE